MAAKRRVWGSGSVQQLPSGKWRATISMGRDPVTGRYKQRKSPTFDKRAEALTWIAEQTVSGNQQGDMKLSVWLEEWLNRKRNTVSPATYKWYKQRALLHISPLLGNNQIDRIDQRAVFAMLDTMEAKKASANCRKNVLRVLRYALQEAVEFGLIRVNHAKAVKPPRVRTKQMVSLTVEEIQKLLQTAEEIGHRLRAFVPLAIDSGARPGELFALTWQDVDWGRSRIRIRASLEFVDGKKALKEPKTRAGVRTIPLTTHTMAALESHRDRMRAELRDTSKGPIFCDILGNHQRPDTFWESFWVPLRKAAGLNIRLYDLRHASASLLVSAGVSLRAVADRLGHEDVKITLKHYAHALPVDETRAVAVMEGLL